MERLPKLVHESDYYPLLLFHLGANNTKGKLENIKQGMVVKGLGAQVIFSSVLPVRVKDGKRSRQIFQVNWMHHWCWQQGFGFYNPGTLLEDQELIVRDGLHLTRRGTCVFANRLGNLVRRALN